MRLHHHIKELRIFSISVTIFTLMCLSQLLNWLYEGISLEEISTQEGVIISSVLASIVALVKFSFTFAMTKSNPTDSNTNKE